MVLILMIVMIVVVIFVPCSSSVWDGALPHVKTRFASALSPVEVQKPLILVLSGRCVDVGRWTLEDSVVILFKSIIQIVLCMIQA